MGKLMLTMDGNTAAAHMAYAFTDVAAIYPITPSSTMAEHIDAWAADGRLNVFGQKVQVKEMQSEAGAAGAVHGSLQAGSLTATFTASQGLLLMIPNMYKIAGELLPGVFHVSARALAGHALSIFGDHQDVMAARATGFAFLASGSVQEVMDLGGLAHLCAIKSRVPFVHFFDGFRTSHEIQKIEVLDYDEIRDLLDYEAVKAFRERSVNPEHPFTRGTAQNPDIYFQEVEAANRYYDAVPDIVSDYMKEMSRVTGRTYKPFIYYGDPEAENIIIAMGSVTQTIEETIDYLRAKGEKVGVVEVHLYRPFSKKYFLDAVPASVKRIAVLDRTKEKGSIGEPLYLDVKSIYYDREDAPLIVGGRYGLGSKDTTPSQINAVFENLKQDEPKNGFTIGIVDDVTHHSLAIKEQIVTEPKSTIKCKFWGFGSDGTVGANKSAIKIIGDGTDMYAQGYFDYDSKKSGGITVSHLRFGHEPIKSTYLISEPDFISCSKQAYVNQYDLLRGIKKGGTFLLNTTWSMDELEEHLPAKLKLDIAVNDVKFYMINATKIAEEIGLSGRINMIMQSAFFKLANVIPIDMAVDKLKQSIIRDYGAKGDDIVNMNFAAVEAGMNSFVEVQVPASWADAKDEVKEKKPVPEFIEKILDPMVRQEGNDLPVSAFVGMEDGTFPAGTSAYEKRGIAVKVPEWNENNCIQCNRCSMVCPHAAVRPFLVPKDAKDKPEAFETIPARGAGLEDYEYRIQVSTLDCTGCGNCAQVCPAKEKALVMKPLDEQIAKQDGNWDYAMSLKNMGSEVGHANVRDTQFSEPLLQFSGACAGCGETAYVKLATQLFGERMMIANATGCSSIWGGSAPSTPYCANQDGRGPSWANSLFEDNAEYGYGMAISLKANRLKLEKAMRDFMKLDVCKETNAILQEWIDHQNDVQKTKEAYEAIVKLSERDFGTPEANEAFAKIVEHKDFIVKKSVWIIGGDGWGYDIGFGGVDHVLASGEDLNILVLDTEVYSNTGGQSSKSTPTAAVAQFAAAGKKVKKKDLGMIAATYGYVYVAQIALGADMNHALQVMKEAESYEGPSLIIAYAPCINHGIRAGMGMTVNQEKLAVEAGYWHLYRFDPRRAEAGQNPFSLDSKEPTGSFMDFIMSEVRYRSLQQKFPEESKALFAKAEKDAKQRYQNYVRMARD